MEKSAYTLSRDHILANEVKVSKALGWKPLKATHPSVGSYIHSLETQPRTVPATMKRLMVTVPLKNSVVWLKRQEESPLFRPPCSIATA